MNETLGKPVVYYEQGDLLVSSYYTGDFILVGLAGYSNMFSFIHVGADDLIPVEVDFSACPKDMFKPFMENTAFYR